MSGPTLPKAVLSTPSQQEDRSERPSLIAALKSAKYLEIVKMNASQSLEEGHQARIKSLRKELDHLKETEWNYESIDKYIGQ